MAVPSSLRALAPPALLPYTLGTSGSARPSPAHRAARGMMVARRRGVAVAAAAVAADAEWLERLPEKEKPLYAHSLPCIEAWLRSVGFAQSREDRAVYLKSGPGNLEKDMERRFSYALSRQDIENAILGGP
uniref:Uncharacterized protein n=1 Tax=Aegilops tauschii TaxID=37682 RepID=M8C1X9_AEGTA